MGWIASDMIMWCYMGAIMMLPALLGYKDTLRESTAAKTDRPVIGVLTQELSYTMKKIYGSENYTSQIVASYVKLIEGAGARVAPILIGQPASYYRRMAESVNGVLLPGGAVYFDGRQGYGAAGQALYREAIRLNQQGDYFPMLGICLGMELIAVEAAGGLSKDIRCLCSSHGQVIPLEFTNEASDSKLFRDAPTNVLNTLRTENVTVNEHGFCICVKDFNKKQMAKDWAVTSVNEDFNGLQFVSSFESRSYPIYGLQFHPEKNIYEWKKSKPNAHSPSAVDVSQYFANFLVREARKNSHKFPEEERENLIYTRQPTDTGKRLVYEQVYFFTHHIEDTRQTDETSPYFGVDPNPNRKPTQ